MNLGGVAQIETLNNLTILFVPSGRAPDDLLQLPKCKEEDTEGGDPSEQQAPRSPSLTQDVPAGDQEPRGNDEMSWHDPCYHKCREGLVTLLKHNGLR